MYYVIYVLIPTSVMFKASYPHQFFKLVNFFGSVVQYESYSSRNNNKINILIMKKKT